MKSAPDMPPANSVTSVGKVSLVDKVAQAVLYEGYILYPYRASAIKNQQRFNFGCLFPPEFSRSQTGSDASTMQTECLLLAHAGTTLDIRVRFLHLLNRQISQLAAASAELPSTGDGSWQDVASLEVGGRVYQTWQEATEREVALRRLSVHDLAAQPRREVFSLPAERNREPLCEPSGRCVGAIVRCHEPLAGSVEVSATLLTGSLYRIRVVIANETPLVGETRLGDAAAEIDMPVDVPAAGVPAAVAHAAGAPGMGQGGISGAPLDRDAALRRSLASNHTILTASNGEFISLLEPGEAFRQAAAECRNVGCWPVLVGEPGQVDTMLSSPIILYDYPEIAPESAGDLFDGTEIDEILMLRIMTLTDDEKREMRSTDVRACEILDRTELLSPDHLMKLHGVLRSARAAGGKAP